MVPLSLSFLQFFFKLSKTLLSFFLASDFKHHVVDLHLQILMRNDFLVELLSGVLLAELRLFQLAKLGFLVEAGLVAPVHDRLCDAIFVEALRVFLVVDLLDVVELLDRRRVPVVVLVVFRALPHITCCVTSTKLPNPEIFFE